MHLQNVQVAVSPLRFRLVSGRLSSNHFSGLLRLGVVVDDVDDLGPFLSMDLVLTRFRPGGLRFVEFCRLPAVVGFVEVVGVAICLGFVEVVS